MSEDGGQAVRDYHDDVQYSDDEVRHYSADGYLYAYREEGDHVVVSCGRERSNTWTTRVPAERTAVVSGEQLWTVPDNWDHRVTIKGAGERRYSIYHIPETDVDVLVTVPHKNHLVDAWYGVKRVGELTVTYDDEIDWDGLASYIDAAKDTDEVSADVVAALETLYRRRDAFEQTFADGVNMYAKDTLFERAHEPVSVDGWTTDPWGTIFEVKPLVWDFLDVDGDTLEGVLRELSRENIIPSYPTVAVAVEDRQGLPDGYDVRALVEAGCSTAETVDYIMTEILDESRSSWGRTRDKDQSTISGNVRQALEKLE